MAKDIGKHFRKILAGRHVSSVQTDISRLRLTDLAEKKRKNQLKQILVKKSNRQKRADINWITRQTLQKKHLGPVQTSAGPTRQTLTIEKTEGNSSDRKHFETDTEKTDINEKK